MEFRLSTHYQIYNLCPQMLYCYSTLEWYLFLSCFGCREGLEMIPPMATKLANNDGHWIALYYCVVSCLLKAFVFTKLYLILQNMQLLHSAIQHLCSGPTIATWWWDPSSLVVLGSAVWCTDFFCLMQLCVAVYFSSRSVLLPTSSFFLKVPWHM